MPDDDPFELPRLHRENMLLRIEAHKRWTEDLKAGKIIEVIESIERYTNFLIKQIVEH